MAGVAREYPATPKVILERVDTWIRRYKVVNTRLNTIGATWLRSYVGTWLRGYAATWPLTQRTRHSHTVMYFYVATWLRGYAATWYLRSHVATLFRITFGVAGYSLVKPAGVVNIASRMRILVWKNVSQFSRIRRNNFAQRSVLFSYVLHFIC